MSGFLLGIDAGSSSIKTSLMKAENGKCIASAFYPNKEMEIIAHRPGWAEQHPDIWWQNLKKCVALLKSRARKEIKEVEAIGITYQMHGLVMVDKNKKVIRPAIIWCDSRAVDFGEEAFSSLGKKFCLQNFLNSPGNFTASKLKWVKENEPAFYKRLYKIMLPGDYLAMKLTGELFTTITGLSEAVLWDFKSMGVATKILDYFGIDVSVVPSIIPIFAEQGYVSEEASAVLGIPRGIPVTYRAGDQPNNAFSLNVCIVAWRSGRDGRNIRGNLWSSGKNGL